MLLCVIRAVQQSSRQEYQSSLDNYDSFVQADGQYLHNCSTNINVYPGKILFNWDINPQWQQRHLVGELELGRTGETADPVVPMAGPSAAPASPGGWRSRFGSGSGGLGPAVGSVIGSEISNKYCCDYCEKSTAGNRPILCGKHVIIEPQITARLCFHIGPANGREWSNRKARPPTSHSLITQFITEQTISDRCCCSAACLT